MLLFVIIDAWAWENCFCKKSAKLSQRIYRKLRFVKITTGIYIILLFAIIDKWVNWFVPIVLFTFFIPLIHIIKTMKKNQLFTLPNFLSAYRILALPFIFWAVYHHNKFLFTILLSINLITDIFDGIIARVFHLETDFGARLDSIADSGTFISAIAGMVFLEREFVTEHGMAFILVLVLYLLVYVVSFLKFRKGPSLHLYSSKVVAYLQGIFLFTFFVFGYQSAYFYFMIVCSCLSHMEEILILTRLSVLRSNCKGILWVLKENNE